MDKDELMKKLMNPETLTEEDIINIKKIIMTKTMKK